MLTPRQVKASLVDLAENGHVFLESSTDAQQVRANSEAVTHVKHVQPGLWVVYTGARRRIRNVLRLVHRGEV